MYSSNSLFFTRNSQMLKKAQSYAYYVSPNGSPSRTPFVQSVGSKKYYYMSNGEVRDALDNSVIKMEPSIAKMAENYKLNNKEEFTNGSPNFGQMQEQTQATQQNNSQELNALNARRQQLGLKPYRSVNEMLLEESKLKREYNAAKASYLKQGISEQEFLNNFPDHLAWTADKEKTKQYSLSAGLHSYADEEILSLIIAHNVEKLDDFEPKEVIRVLHDFIKKLPRFNPRREDLQSYQESLVDTHLAYYNFTNKNTINYIVKLKMREADSIIRDFERMNAQKRQQTSQREQRKQMRQFNG
jgi:hypothetical protein